MPRVRFTSNLDRFFPGLKSFEAPGSTVAEILDALEPRWPGLCDYLVDERGALRKHVTIYVDGEPVADRTTLRDPVPPKGDVFVAQALSGG